jgi:hypothetical protein
MRPSIRTDAVDSAQPRESNRQHTSYADVCWRMLQRSRANPIVSIRRTLTYADVCFSAAARIQCTSQQYFRVVKQHFRVVKQVNWAPTSTTASKLLQQQHFRVVKQVNWAPTSTTASKLLQQLLQHSVASHLRQRRCNGSSAARIKSTSQFTSVTSTTVQTLTEATQRSRANQIHITPGSGGVTIAEMLSKALSGQRSLWGLKLLVYEALSYQCMRP